MEKLRWLYVYASVLRILPAYFCLCCNRFRKKCAMDLDAWIRHEPEVRGHIRFWQFGYLIIYQKECRNILLNRLHRNPLLYVIVRMFFSPLPLCYINMPPEKIGGGFSFQHGFSTIVAAREIGENCRVYQQVTIGYREKHAPVIGNNVEITVGAIVIGNVYIGDGAVIGAGAVVVHDVSADTTVIGVPARPIL